LVAKKPLKKTYKLTKIIGFYSFFFFLKFIQSIRRKEDLGLQLAGYNPNANKKLVSFDMNSNL
jgi:hypothetical protein